MDLIKLNVKLYLCGFWEFVLRNILLQTWSSLSQFLSHVLFYVCHIRGLFSVCFLLSASHLAHGHGTV